MKLLILLAGLVLCQMSALAAPVVQLEDFRLYDQDEKPRAYHFPKTKITVMTVADHKGSSQLAPWIQRLHDRYGQRIDIDGVADVSMIARPFQGIFRTAFRQQLTYSVMLDWSGSVVKQFGYAKGVANLFVIDRRGGIRRRITGTLSEDGLRELCRQIDRAIEET